MDRRNIVGQVMSIYIQRGKGEPRKSVPKVILVKDKGILGDAYAEGGNRQISIISTESKEEINSLSIKGLCTERFHENITINDLDIEKLNIGSRIQIGETIQEVTKIGKRCFPECNIVEKREVCPLVTQVVFTKVLKEGIIKKDDSIIISELCKK